MDNNFKITSMSFNYAVEVPAVTVNFSATFDTGNTVAGTVNLTLVEFSSNTDGLTGYIRLVKEKLTKDFEALETK